MANALVTGSSGFIGKKLVKKLQKSGFNLLTVTHDILENGNELRSLFTSYKPKIVFNLQAYGNHSSQSDEYEMIKSNIIYTHNLASIAKASGVELFVQFGSSSEYGLKEEPMSEEDSLDPITMYGATKGAASLLLRPIACETFKVVVIRPFSIYGPSEASFRFIPTIISKIKKKEVMPIDGNAVHDWTYIDDFINGVVTVLNPMMQGESNYEVVNIGTGTQYTNREIFAFICSIMNKKTPVKEMVIRGYDTKHWVADNTKLKEMGWFPQYDIVLGLTHTVAHYNSL